MNKSKHPNGNKNNPKERKKAIKNLTRYIAINIVIILVMAVIFSILGKLFDNRHVNGERVRMSPIQMLAPSASSTIIMTIFIMIAVLLTAVLALRLIYIFISNEKSKIIGKILYYLCIVTITLITLFFILGIPI